MSGGPLISWDIYIESYNRMMKRLEDLQQVKDFADRSSWLVEWDMDELILREGRIALVTDPSLSIVFATPGIFDMNGYNTNEILGNRPTMFQGERTSPIIRSEVHTAVEELRPFHAVLTNYRKDGSLYDCDIKAYPVYNLEKEHVHFVAFEKIAA